MIWLSLLLLSLITYFIVQRSVTRVTRTPAWILWLLLMMPAFIISFWALTNGENEPIPLSLLVGSFLVCSFLYFVMVQVGRVALPSPASPEQTKPEAAAASEAKSNVHPLTKAEETTLQSCFPWGIFYLQQMEYRPQAVICRGQLRSKPEVAYQTIRDNVANHFGDRFVVIFQLGGGNKPFFALVPNLEARDQTRSGRKRPLARPMLALGLLLVTLLTTTIAGLELAEETLSLEILRSNPAVLWSGLPYALSLLGILAIHELGHYSAARFYRIRATLPYFIPFPFAIGTFGAFIQMRSPVPNRRALFDVGLAGPLSGLVVTLPVLLWGLAHSQIVPLPTDAAETLNFRAFNPRISILLVLLSRLVLGSELGATTAIQFHPVAIAGCLGLVVTALNLMPVGQLDGGHIIHAMFGQRAGALIGQVTRLLVLILSLVQPWLLFWGIILLFIPVVDEPALNDVTELDNSRDFLGLAALSVLLLIVLPLPNSVATFLFTTHLLP